MQPTPASSAPHKRPSREAVRRRRRRRAMRRLIGITIVLCVAAGVAGYALSRNSAVPSDNAADTPDTSTTAPSQITSTAASDSAASASSTPTNALGLNAAEAQAMLDDPLMILVNHQNPMPENYTFDTAKCGSPTATNKELQTVACNAFLQLQAAAAADGVTVNMQSGYRSVQYQSDLYVNKTNYFIGQGYDEATAKEMAAAVVNPPGYSEHNCGLAADLNTPEHPGLDEGFKDTAAFTWLCEHAGDYGFILRYPLGKEDVTEITYEPWHWRYVGAENAAKINASGLCFEEYIDALRSIASAV